MRIGESYIRCMGVLCVLDRSRLVCVMLVLLGVFLEVEIERVVGRYRKEAVSPLLCT